MSTPAIRILSLGAGVQSTVLALMACDGTLPGLDAAVFADTGWEPPAVYEQVDRLAAELARVDIPLYRVSSGNLRADTLDPAHRFVSVPYFTLAPAGTEVPVYGVCAPCGGSGRGPSDEPDSCSVCGGDGRGSIVGTRLATATERHGMGRRQCTSEYRRIRKGGASANPLDGEAFLHRSRVPLDLAPIDRVTRAEYADMQLDLFEDGDPDGCSPYGCRSGEVVA